MSTLSRDGAARSAAPESPAPGLDLVRLVDTSVLETTPFEHVCLEGAFPAALYRRLLDNLPETPRYRELRHPEAMQADGHSARRKFYLYPEHVWLLPAGQRAVWLDLARLLRSPALQEAFKRKFRGALERRFGRPLDRLTFYPVPILVRDLGGYRLGIHADTLRKAITVQFYLPRDDSQIQLGTIFHEGPQGAAAQRTRRLPFRPATGYAFPVVPDGSWHSVAPTTAADGPRDSLMLTYYVQDGLGGWLAQRAKRLAVFLGYGLRR